MTIQSTERKWYFTRSRLHQIEVRKFTAILPCERNIRTCYLTVIYLIVPSTVISRDNIRDITSNIHNSRCFALRLPRSLAFFFFPPPQYNIMHNKASVSYHSLPGCGRKRTSVSHAAEMDFDGSRYYKINRMMLSSIGLWPYQNVWLTRIQRVFCLVCLVSLTIFQVFRRFRWKRQFCVWHDYSA